MSFAWLPVAARWQRARSRSWRRCAAALFLFSAASFAQNGQAASLLDRVLAAKTLRVCIWPAYYAISYRDPRTLQLSGIDIDLARALAADLGVEPVFVDSAFASLADDLQQARCDVAMFAIGITPERALKLRFTQPYLRSDLYAIASRASRRIRDWSDIDRRGSVVAVTKGTYQETVMREALKQASLVVLDTAPARDLEVQSGRADVFITDFPYSQRMLATTDWARLVAPPAPVHPTSYAYAVRPGDARWLARLDAFVRAIKRDGRLQSAARRHRLEAIALGGA
jgi:ABC-type amino acid transport substrate-binding protein